MRQLAALNAWCLILACASLASTATAQQVVALPEAEYDRLKAAGQLPENAIPISPGNQGPAQVMRMGGGSPKGGGGGNNGCDCWISPDASYPLAMPPNDDSSSPLINLPFQFSLYGDLYNTVFINNNGNLSFVQSFGTYTSTGFPNAIHRMVAPFWADVDTRFGQGQVRYKVTPTALYVNWIGVGYYTAFGMPANNYLVNSFQVIITNGNDPVIGVGNNVSFCYLDMQWTTGNASGGTNGFGGTPATVGANRGQGTGDYIQFGRFGLNSAVYDGPFGNTDGVHWLDYKNFRFTTAVSTQNIPPIASSLLLCDTIQVCVGEVVEIQMDFLSPESDQVTVATSSAPGLSNYTETTNTTGITATIIAQFSPQLGEEGYQTITFTGTDNGSPPLTSTVDIVIYVIPGPPPPVISGPEVICEGGSAQLNANPGGFDNYSWNTGASGQSINVGAGTYTVTISDGGCPVTSAPFTVSQVELPPLVIDGPAVYCGEPLPTLTASAGYDAYVWSNGGSGANINAGAGTYTVTGTVQGCTNTSASFTLTEVDPGPPVIVGDSQLCAGDNVTLSTNANAYDNVLWSSGQSTASITATAGTYTVTATFLNCTYTSAPFIVTQIELPPVAISGNSQYCAGGSVTLSAPPGFDSWIWSNGASGPGTTVQGGTYTVTVTLGPCSSTSAPFTVTEVPNPVPVITGPTFACGGGTVRLSTTQPFSTYNWSNGSGAAAVNVGSGSYTVTVTNAFGCVGTSAPYVVLVEENPTAHFIPAPPSPQPPGTNVVFQDASQGNGGTITNWWWDLGDGSGSAEQSPNNTYGTPGAYTVTLVVTTANGCVDSVSFVYVIRPEEIVIPNVFTPNNDGYNDVFVIENIQFYPNNLTIFNRWGTVVYQTRNYANQWRGLDTPEGTYFYVLKLEEGREFTGHLTVLR